MTEFSGILKRVNLPKIQKITSLGFLWLSALLLFLSFVALGLAWYHAFQDGWIPDVWGTYEGNHGPWRRYHPGRELVMYALSFQMWSVPMAFISALIKRSRAGIWLLVISILIFLGAMYTHYWLVD